MHPAIAIGQGVGLAVACGLIALIPLGVGALAALAGFLPGALGAYHHSPLVAVSVIAGAINAAAAVVLPAAWRLPLATISGAVCFELAAGHLLPYAGIVIGGAIAAGSCLIVTRIVDGSQRRGATRSGIVVLTAAAAIVAAAAAIIPFVGYLLCVAAGWLAYRIRRQADQKYAGLRVLR
jgi:hypothetical protein